MWPEEWATAHRRNELDEQRGEEGCSVPTFPLVERSLGR